VQHRICRKQKCSTCWPWELPGMVEPDSSSSIIH
jgi:hypothetical protein